MPLLTFNEFNIHLDVDKKFLAHLSSDRKTTESLKAHIDLVYAYFLHLVSKNNLENHLNELFEKSVTLLGRIDQQEAFANWVKYLFSKAIYWHDMGKINPNFQVDKMGNDQFKNSVLSEESNHSPLGAYLFINHSLQELYAKQWDEDEIEIIETITYLFGYLISKHHGNLYKNDELVFGEDLTLFLQEFAVQSDNIKVHKEENRTFGSIYDYIENNKEILFLLSKSLFSLLIISDYYATAQFMNYGNVDGLKYDDFGLIDNEFRDNVYNEFYTDKLDKVGKKVTFNQILKEKKSEDFRSFDELQEKSNDNLNHLRNKLFVEVRDNLRHNIDKNLFYIEAPTGAGKTNLSIMSAVEILKNDKTINKFFYVFPFTTLITQTYEAIKTTLNLDNSQIVQLHSKAKYNEKESDGIYGDEKTNFLDNQFMNYPITLLSHVKFFDILTGVSKDDNYIFHRLANSIVIIDEIQTYNPSLWSSIAYLLDSFAKHFTIKFIVMSATLPKIGNIIDSQFVFLVSNKQDYFQNPNFAQRVDIDTNTIKIKESKEIYQRVEKESKAYQQLTTNETKKVKTIIEFITKKGADEFYSHVQESNQGKKKLFDTVFILSGTVLEPRRKEIITFLKNTHDQNILLVTTQVVEAGVDIDMDIGFKEKSLVDSDEQLAGRINRNSSKKGNKLFLFEMENSKAKFVYKGDKRLIIQNDSKVKLDDVLKNKDFDTYYNQVIDTLKGQNDTPFIENLYSYIDHIKNLRFSETHIKIIDMESISVFVPINDEAIAVWEEYEKAIQNKEQDLIDKKISLKQLASKISQYTFSLAKYQGSGVENLLPYCKDGKEKYGYLYLEEYKNIYSYEDGLDTKVLKGTKVGMFI